MLDIGHEFLQVIEKDWGKLTRKALTFFIILFIVSFSIHYTLAWIVEPIFRSVMNIIDTHIAHHSYTSLGWQVTAVIITVCISAALSLCVWEGYLFTVRYRINRIKREAHNEVALVRAECKRTYDETTAFMKKCDKELNELNDDNQLLWSQSRLALAESQRIIGSARTLLDYHDEQAATMEDS